MPMTNEIGVMFWAGGDPAETLRDVAAMGVKCGQLGIPGDLDLSGQATAWKKAADKTAFRIVTVFAAYEGESYTNIASVRQTVGFVPSATRAAREERTLEVSRFAQELGVPGIATHIGCVPENRNNPEYYLVMQTVQRICDYAAHSGQTFALETGQETAEALLEFVREVNRPNLGINFDPANMILYGTGDPVEALRVLGIHVLSVHCKDGDWPAERAPNALGEERALGNGAVDLTRFLAELDRIGYKGSLNVERENSDATQRTADIEAGIALLKKLQLSFV